MHGSYGFIYLYVVLIHFEMIHRVHVNFISRHLLSWASGEGITNSLSYEHNMDVLFMGKSEKYGCDLLE